MSFGHGNQPVICFHGYDEEAADFLMLQQRAGDLFRFYCIDLPYHGRTRWSPDAPFDKEVLRYLFNAIDQEHQQYTRLHALENFPQYTLLGFSLGGRVALSTLEAGAGKVNRVVLLAPDGLKVNFWYWLATQTIMGKRLFLFTMKNPGWFLTFLMLLRRMNLVNQSVYKFVQFYIHDENMRLRLYNRWISLSRLRPDLKQIKSLIRNRKIATRIVYGHHDAGPDCKVIIIGSGHQVLHGKHAEEIIKALKH
jgi:pimeloyl-ACP methyl ester carboxylesterase